LIPSTDIKSVNTKLDDCLNGNYIVSGPSCGRLCEDDDINSTKCQECLKQCYTWYENGNE